jgi:ribosome-associated protein
VISIIDGLAIPETELSFTASRSGGPGGQNVNKVSTKVTLLFDLAASTVLSDEQKRKISGKLAKRINKEGVLQIVSQRTRSQELNRADALARFSELLSAALTPQEPRIKTRIPRAAKHQRIEQKKKRALTKQARSSKGWES